MPNKSLVYSAVFSITLFLSAFLLFTVQPMVSKALLPLFGGSPAVWNSCMVYFQALLLLGYCYSHYLTKNFSFKWQLFIHSAMFVLAFIFIPLKLGGYSLPENSQFPILSIFAALSLSAALPFFVLSTSAPLIQKWFSWTNQADAKDPYFLYAASNAGSLIALLAYPFLIEPQFYLKQQSSLWSFTFIALAGFILVCAFLTAISGKNIKKVSAPVASAKNSKISGRQKLKWAFLSFVPSSLMLGLTMHISTDIAAVPLVWVVPLALYLLTFILVFANKKIISEKVIVVTFPRIVIFLALAIALKVSNPLKLILPFSLLSFFVMAMLCHSRLVKERPSASHLTEFYLWMSIGGALGGVFNSLLAPLIFDRPIEYAIAIALSCLALPMKKSKDTAQTRRADWLIPVFVGLFMYMVFNFILPALASYTEDELINKIGMFIFAGIPVVYILSLRNRPLRFALALGIYMIIGVYSAVANQSVLLTKRSFFGVSIISKFEVKGDVYHIYQHGTTTHGMQAMTPQKQQTALGYYHAAAPIADVFRVMNTVRSQNNIAIMGLGSGGLAVYAKKADVLDYYEIDQAVIDIAENEKYFTFLKNCPAKNRVILGDARLEIMKAPDGFYDLIIMDAFSSDSIPMHLLTHEALQMYFKKLSEKGTVVIHISNRYLKLKPVISALGESLSLKGLTRIFISQPKTPEEKKTIFSSEWCVFSKDPAVLERLQKDFKWKELPANQSRVRVWTDDYSNILSALKG